MEEIQKVIASEESTRNVGEPMSGLLLEKVHEYVASIQKNKGDDEAQHAHDHSLCHRRWRVFA